MKDPSATRELHHEVRPREFRGIEQEAAALVAEADRLCAAVGQRGYPRPHETRRLREINDQLEARR